MKKSLLSALFALFSFLIFAQKSQLQQDFNEAFKANSYETAIALGERLMSYLQEKQAPEDSLYLKNLNQLAESYWAAQQLEKSLKLYEQARAICAKVYGKKTWEYSEALGASAYIYADLAEYEQAKLLYLESKQRLEEVGTYTNTNEYAMALNNIAYVMTTMGENEEALGYLQESLAIYKKQGRENTDDYLISLNNLAVAYYRMKQYRQAEIYFLENKDIVKKNMGKNSRAYARSMTGLGATYTEMKQYEKAVFYFLEEIATLSVIVGKEHTDYAFAINNLASLYINTQRYDEALPLIQKALAINLKVLGQKNPVTAHTWGTLARYYQRIDDIDKSLIYNIKCLRANTQSELDTSSLTRLLATLPQAKFIDFNTAANALESFIFIFYNKYKETTDKKWLDLYQQTNKAALLLFENNKNNFSSENDKLLLISNSIGYTKKNLQYIQLLQKDSLNADAFQLVEQCKAALLADALKSRRARAFGGLPDSLVQKELALQQKISELQKLQLSSQDSLHATENRHELQNSQRAFKTFMEKLAKEYPQYHQLKYARHSLSLKELQAQIPDKTAVLEYFVSDGTVYLFCITRQSQRLLCLSISFADFEKEVRELRYNLTDYEYITQKPEKAFESYTQIAHHFYSFYLSDALAGLQGIEQLVFIPDNLLGHIPFEVLLVEKPAATGSMRYQDLHYLLKDYRISYNYSASLWSENQFSQPKKNAKPGQILAMAAEYGNLDSLALSRLDPNSLYLRKNLSPLPAAKQEIHALSKDFKGIFQTRTSATEANFKQLAPDFDIIHLAMHGIMNSHHPILSSLAFSEDGKGGEDNFLQAYEISGLQLNASLVVLSACETGYGKFQAGEGVMSLARSFMYAGVPALVVSLWSVNDASTADIMEFFYNNLNAGMDKAQALQQAKIQYLSNAKGVSAHPAYWSAFIQLGDSRAINIAQKDGWAWWWWLGGALLLLPLFFNVKRWLA